MSTTAMRRRTGKQRAASRRNLEMARKKRKKGQITVKSAVNMGALKKGQKFTIKALDKKSAKTLRGMAKSWRGQGLIQ